MQIDNKIKVNNNIRSPQVRVVLEDGTNLGIMNTRDALRMAQEQDLDMIEINPKAAPPVVKFMNFGKFKYEEKKRQAEIRKSQKIQEMKEITFRPNTDANDLNHKLESAKEFLAEGHKVKFTIKFRGREVTHPEIAKDKIIWILKQLNDLIQPPAPIAMEGKFMFLVVAPVKK